MKKTTTPVVSAATCKEIKHALEGDSGDAEHDALAAVAAELGIDWLTYETLNDDCEFEQQDRKEWYCDTHETTMVGPYEPANCSTKTEWLERQEA